MIRNVPECIHILQNFYRNNICICICIQILIVSKKLLALIWSRLQWNPQVAPRSKGQPVSWLLVLLQFRTSSVCASLPYSSDMVDMAEDVVNQVQLD